MPHPLTFPLLKWAGRLRYPTLVKLLAALFVVDFLLPDPFPFVDELLLGLGTVALANFKLRRNPPPLPGA